MAPSRTLVTRKPAAALFWGPGCQVEFRPLCCPTETKLKKEEEAALLSWEIYLKENYLHNQQYQHQQQPEQRIQDISEKCVGRALHPTGTQRAGLMGPRAYPPGPGAGSPSMGVKETRP